MINIRKLAAVEMAWLGTGVIITEYALGASMPLFLGVFSIRSALLSPILVGWEVFLGAWLIAISVNYIPLFIYAILIARTGSAKEEGQAEIARARKYGSQQVIILIPLMVVIFALVQESRRAGK